MTPEESSPALEALQALDAQAEKDEALFDWEHHYAAELAQPEVAQLHSFFHGLDTYALHTSGKAAPVDPESDGQWVYGDTGVPLIYRLLRRWGATRQDVFYDLGCGCGLPVFAASLLCGRAVGVDVVEPVVNFCKRAASFLSSQNTEFHCQDLFATDVRSATFVYLACTTFPPSVRARLAEKMLETRPGTKILTVTHPLEGKGLRRVVKTPQVFSWSGHGPGYPFEFFLHQRY